MWNASTKQDQCECQCGKSGCNSRVVGVNVHGVPGGSKRCSCDECRAADNTSGLQRVAELQRLTLPGATRKGQQWTTAELELLSRKELSSREIATRLQRSYTGVKTMRSRLNKEPKLQLAVFGEIR